MSHQAYNKLHTVDVIIPVYRERTEALTATLAACLTQTYPVSKIFVVDDGSPEPVFLPAPIQPMSKVCLIRLPYNQGISAARNAAIARSDALFIACINTQVLPDSDWLATCVDYLSRHEDVGACYTRLVAHRPNRILTRWRMRFLETKFGEETGLSEFAPGHAVLFRRTSVDRVGGYDVRRRLHHEDSDICRRIGKCGWATHYIANSRCVSIQEDSLSQLAAKELRECGWYSPAESSLIHLYVYLSKWTLIRAGRNIWKRRFDFIPIDVAIWASALWIATSRALFASVRRR